MTFDRFVNWDIRGFTRKSWISKFGVRTSKRCVFENATLTFMLAWLLELTGLYVNEPPRKWVHAVLCTYTRNTSKRANFIPGSIIKQLTRTSFDACSKCVLEVVVEGVAFSQKMDRTYPSTSRGSLACLHNSICQYWLVKRKRAFMRI